MTSPTPPRGTLRAHIAVITRAFNARTVSTVEINGTNQPPFPASLIRWLLLEAKPPADTTITRVCFKTVTITGMLDLAATTLTLFPRFRDCQFIGPAKDAGITLNDATGIGIEILGGTLAILEANRLKLSGSLILRSAAIDTEDPPQTGGKLTIEHGITLCGATIHGNLDCRGTTIGPLAPLTAKPKNTLDERIAILADGLAVDGNFLFSEGAIAEGEIRINGATIQRDLNCTGATLNNPGGYTLSAAGAQIRGSLFFNAVPTNKPAPHPASEPSAGKIPGAAAGSAPAPIHEGGKAKPAKSLGLIRLDGAHIFGNLDFSGAELTAREFTDPKYQDKPEQAALRIENKNEKYLALTGEGLTVDAILNMSKDFKAQGSIWLTFAKIGDRFEASNASFRFAGGAAICADAAEIDGVLSLKKSNSNGIIRLVQAKIGQGADFEGFQFDADGEPQNEGIGTEDLEEEYGKNLCGLCADGATVGGTFDWKGMVKPKPAANPGDPSRSLIFSAAGATVTELDDDEASWKAVKRIDLRDCTYTRITAFSGDGGNARKTNERSDPATTNWKWALVPFIILMSLHYGPWFVTQVSALAKMLSRTLGHGTIIAMAIMLVWMAFELSKNKSSHNMDWRMDLLDREYAAWNQRPWSRPYFIWNILYQSTRLGRRRDNHRDKNDSNSLKAQIRRFSPGPYLQLASVLQNAGLQQASQEVLLRLERNRTCYGGLSLSKILGRFILDAAIGYGSKPFRPVVVVIIWTFISWDLFNHFYYVAKDMAAAKPDDPQFSGLFYAFDSLIPFVDFDQRKTYPILNMMSPAGALLAFNTFIGYAAASFLAAGLSGLAKLGKDGDND